MTELPVSVGWETVIGQRGPAAAGVAEVALRSGVLEVDPLANWPVLVLNHPDPALVAELFGDAAAGSLTHGDPITVERTDVLSELCRLGELLWLERSGALALDRGLLAAEVAVARAVCAPYLDPEEESDPTLADLVDPFVAAAQRLRHGLALPEGFAELIGRGLDYLEPESDSPWLERLRHERELFAAAARWPDVADWAALDAELAALGAPRPSHLGGDDLSGTDSVDWARVPPALLPAAEGTVRYQVVRRPDAALVIVDVAAAPGPAAPPVLSLLPVETGPAVASLFCPPLPIALARGPLQSGLTGWHAEFALPADGAALINGPLLLDIRSDLVTRPPLMGLDRAIAQAYRQSVRAASLRRLTAMPGLGDGVREGARTGFRFAARLWNRVAADPTNADPIRVRELVDQCAALATAEHWSGELSVAERWYCHAR